MNKVTSSDFEVDASSSYFLGINCAHDAAACIVNDKGVLVAIREERLSRKKHHTVFPKLAINYCLETVGISLKNITNVTINQYSNMACELC